MHRLLLCRGWMFSLAALVAVRALGGDPELPAEKQSTSGTIEWHTDYAEAYRQAQASQKYLFVYFHTPARDTVRSSFETHSLVGSVLSPHRDRYVWVKVPTDARFTIDGREQRLLSHAAWGELHGQAGIAIVDLAHQKTAYYRQVVSAFPFPTGTYYGPRHLSVILGLPPGSLTQRTLVYAVRVHPEAPASAWGKLSTTLAREAENHSHHQASIGVQGHHNWDSRFQYINTQLPSGLIAQEVVAESWPGQDMLSAAHECVNSWRQSDGHWDAVRTRHGLFGFDLKRGHNGIWYGTGLFGRFHR